MSKKLFAGGLSWDTDDEGLRQAFEQFGEIVEAKDKSLTLIEKAG